MKLLLGLCLTAIVSTTAFSQMEKGTWTLGGTGSGSASLGRIARKSMSFQVTPQAGLFLFKNFLLGTAIGAGYFNYEYGSGTYSGFGFEAGLYSRYYFNVGKEQTTDSQSWKPFSLFPELSARISNDNGRGSSDFHGSWSLIFHKSKFCS